MSELKGDESLSEFPNLKLPQLLFVWEKNGAPEAQLQEVMVGACARAVPRTGCLGSLHSVSQTHVFAR